MPYSSSSASGRSEQPPSATAGPSHIIPRPHFSQLPPLDTNLRGFGSVLAPQHARSEPPTPTIPYSPISAENSAWPSTLSASSSAPRPIPSAGNAANDSPPSLPPPSAQELRQLYSAGSIRVRSLGRRTWELECSKCAKCATWINSSISCTRELMEAVLNEKKRKAGLVLEKSPATRQWAAKGYRNGLRINDTLEIGLPATRRAESLATRCRPHPQIAQALLEKVTQVNAQGGSLIVAHASDSAIL
ncbi:hypothetical protein B0H14DRAFT_3691642 [Mycena olivaceomarginata]|nr:hypothetical protein B0H14DRAFT_3691642 [Mycena olivaceomarginata]